MRTLVILMGLISAAWAQDRNGQERQAPDRFQKPKPKSPEPQVAVRGGIEASIDDNILELSSKQLDQLDAGTSPQKFRIDDPEDVVYSPWIDLELRAHPFKQPTTFGLKVQVNTYQESSIASYEEYRLFVKQDLGRHEAGIEYALEWDRYHRQLKLAPKVWDSAFYSEHDLELFYRHRVTDAFGVRASLGWIVRDFDSPFQYRDQRGWVVGLRPGLEPIRNWRVFLGYEYKSVEAAADSAVPDTSYLQHEIEPGTSVELFDKRLEIVLRYSLGFREYTSGNSPAVDPSHLDREDERSRIALDFRFKITRNWAAEFGFRRWVIDSDRPFDTSDTDEESGSKRQVFTIGASFRF